MVNAHLAYESPQVWSSGLYTDTQTYMFLRYPTYLSQIVAPSALDSDSFIILLRVVAVTCGTYSNSSSLHFVKKRVKQQISLGLTQRSLEL